MNKLTPLGWVFFTYLLVLSLAIGVITVMFLDKKEPITPPAVKVVKPTAKVGRDDADLIVEQAHKTSIDMLLDM